VEIVDRKLMKVQEQKEESKTGAKGENIERTKGREEENERSRNKVLILGFHG
jgi:hypothetical protein